MTKDNQSILSKAFSFLGIGAQDTEMKFYFDNPFGFSMKENIFVEYCLKSLYSKILTDCFSRSADIDEELKGFFWDTTVKSYGKSNAGDGLITMISMSMLTKQDLFMIYKDGVLRKATSSEESEIKRDFTENKKASSIGGHWSVFTNYTLTDILKILFCFQYIILSSTYTGMNISKALQVKISKLRETIANNERNSAIKQAQDIASGLKEGKGVLLDVLDKIETAQVDMTSTETAISFINGLIAFYINMPLSYVNGVLTKGISTTGESDAIAVERGLLSFFNSIFKPIVDDLFDIDISFISENWRLLQASSEVLRMIELISDDIMPLIVKQRVCEAVFREFYEDKDKLSTQGNKK